MTGQDLSRSVLFELSNIISHQDVVGTGTTDVSSPPAVTVSSGSEPCVNCVWGNFDGKTFSLLIRDAYEEVVHWRQNVSLVPPDKSGNNFVLELAKVYQAFGNDSSIHSIAFTACSAFFQVLLLQKPHVKSKSKEHSVWNAALLFCSRVTWPAYYRKENVFRIFFLCLIVLSLNPAMLLVILIILYQWVKFQQLLNFFHSQQRVTFYHWIPRCHVVSTVVVL